MEVYLYNILLFSLILFVIALIVAMVQVILMLIDLRQVTRDVKKMVKDVEQKVKSIISVLDVAKLLMGSMDEIGRRVTKGTFGKSTWSAVFAGIKKGFTVFSGRDK